MGSKRSRDEFEKQHHKKDKDYNDKDKKDKDYRDRDRSSSTKKTSTSNIEPPIKKLRRMGRSGGSNNGIDKTKGSNKYNDRDYKNNKKSKDNKEDKGDKEFRDKYVEREKNNDNDNDKVTTSRKLRRIVRKPNEGDISDNNQEIENMDKKQITMTPQSTTSNITEVSRKRKIVRNSIGDNNGNV